MVQIYFLASTVKLANIRLSYNTVGKALYGGGGSGYVNYIEIQPGGEAFVKMRAYAGSGGEDSYALLVGEEGDDSELVRGRAGMDSDDGGSENGGAGENCNEMSLIELT